MLFITKQGTHSQVNTLGLKYQKLTFNHRSLRTTGSNALCGMTEEFECVLVKTGICKDVSQRVSIYRLIR